MAVRARKIEMITENQKKFMCRLAFVELRLLQWELYDLIDKMCEAKRVRDLTKKQAIAVIDQLVDWRDGKERAKDAATPQQLFKIEQLESELQWKDNPNRLKAFMKKYCGTERMEWLDFCKASSLIESLKKVKAGQIDVDEDT